MRDGQHMHNHRRYRGEVFIDRGDACWSLVVPEEGTVGQDGCVQYSGRLESTQLDDARADFNAAVDRLIQEGELDDRESPADEETEVEEAETPPDDG